MGYFYINQKDAPLINIFLTETFNPYLNFHKPCAFPTTTIDKKGKEKKIYKQQDDKTPYAKCISIPGFHKYLQKGITAESWKQIATCMSDNEYAAIVSEKKEILFNKIGLDPMDF